MTQEEKQLLLKDLCARLPYGVKLRYVEDLVVKKESHIITLNNIYLEHILNGDADIKPYLRKISSITEEELKELVNLNLTRINSYRKDFVIKETEFFLGTCWYVQIAYKDNNGDECVTNLYVGRGSSIEEIDWLNKKHFDYRGLIPMGLALEAPEGMYDIKTE